MFFWLGAPEMTDTSPSEVEPDLHDPLSGMTLDDLECDERRCIADGWISDAQRVRAAITRRVCSVGAATEMIAGE